MLKGVQSAHGSSKVMKYETSAKNTEGKRVLVVVLLFLVGIQDFDAVDLNQTKQRPEEAEQRVR